MEKINQDLLMDKSGLNAIYDASKRTIICKDENTPEKQENSKDE